VIKFVSGLRQVSGFLCVLWFRSHVSNLKGDLCDRDRIVIGYTTT
jgi:hypothetical protein